MTSSLAQETVTTIKNSAELITQNDIAISIKMYDCLFLKYPEIKHLFAHKTTEQYMRLAETLSAYAVNIDKIECLKPALKIIAEEHVKVKMSNQVIILWLEWL